MIWEPFVLALALGIVISAGIYFAYLWPQVAPDDDLDSTPAAADEPATDAGTASAP